MPKYREKMELAQQRMEEAKAKMEEEKEESKEARREIKELASWAEVFDDSQPDVRKMIIARLVERIDVGADYSVKIRLKINMRQYTIRGRWRKGKYKEPRRGIILYAVLFASIWGLVLTRYPSRP